MKTRTLDGFGARLAALRQSRGLTQAELGTAAGVSQRVIAYYETETTQPPGALLVDLARALKVTRRSQGQARLAQSPECRARFVPAN